MNQFRYFILSGAFAASLLFLTNPSTSHALLVYSHFFEEGVEYVSPGSPQYDDWITFRASLPAQGVTGITLNGSRNSTGRSCDDPQAAQQIADGLRNFTNSENPIDTIVTEVECGGFNWRVVNCGESDNSVMIRALSEEDDPEVCSCDATYALGPAIFDGDWGGIDGPICDAQSQVINLLVRTGPRPIPTLSEWGLIAMAGILGLVGLYVVKRKRVTV